ncbi:MAG: penicillin-binding transpeptidase domain-containing protein, partial [Acidimicrobiia bacterium]
MRFGLRLTGIAALFMSLFAVLGMRLWFVQVAEGAENARRAQTQTWEVVDTPAPRGDIRDRDGVLLATSKFVPAIVVDRRRVPEGARPELVQSLSSLLGIPAADIDQAYEEAGPAGRFRVAEVDVATAYQMNEELRRYPGVTIEPIPQRDYQMGSLAAHVIGHIGRVTAEDVEANPGIDPNGIIGRLGVERAYDDYLQGAPGQQTYRINSRFEVIQKGPEVPARQGATVYLNFDLGLQTHVEEALERGVELANDVKADMRRDGEEVFHDSERAVGLVLDVNTGAVLAMASYPDFDPQSFVGGIDEQAYRRLQEERAFSNLAISGLYPPASTFKGITYVTAMEEGIRPAGPNADPATGEVNCDGLLELPGFDEGSPQRFFDWYHP